MALAIERQPSGYLAMREGIQALMQAGQYKSALQQLTMVPSPEAEWLDDAAGCYMQLGDGQTAMKLLEMAVVEAPRSAALWGKLGAVCWSWGDMERAQEAFRQALRLEPKSVRALCALNRIKTFSRTSQRTRLLRKLALSKQVTRADRCSAWNALGHIEAAAGNHSEAFRYFLRSKSLGAQRHDRDLFEAYLADQAALYDGKRPSLRPASGQPRIVFVCGMPRSGTTLVEHILCRHPEVGAAGETPALMRSLERLRGAVQKSHGERSPWGWYKLASEGMLAAARADYLEQIAGALTEEPKGVIVDKLPFNCLALGYAHLILPEARFVVMSRHPLDVGLSNLATQFAQAQPYSHDLSDMAHMMQIAEASVAQYEAVCGQGMRRQSYRRLVEAPEAEVRGLLVHAGLSWDTACLHPEERAMSVRTASVTQVRAPINAGALEKWRNYEAELEPLVEALGGAQALAEWAAQDAALGRGQVA